MINITRGTGDNGQPELTIKLNNGDLALFDSVMSKWRFENGVGLLRFIFTILSKAENNTVDITDNTGKKVSLEPATNLIIPSANGIDGANSGNNTPQQPPEATAQ